MDAYDRARLEREAEDLLIRYDCHVVDFLRDEKGIYGIWINEQSEEVFREIRDESCLYSLIIRPDRLSDTDKSNAILQPLFSAGRSPPYRGCVEEVYRRLIHHKMLGRAGLPWDGWPGGEKAEEWWSSDRAQQNANRRKYHGLKLSSLQIVNALIRGALAVANRDALKQARRFPFKLRYPLYVAGAMHIRNLQVIEAFPVLAVAIFEERKFGAYKYHPLTVAEARDMILRGKPLRDIAKIMSVPWVLKRVKPGAVREACHGGPSTIEASLIEAYLPWRVRDMKTWFLATHSAQDVSPDFVRWCARNAMSLGDDFEMVVQDIGDWVNASFNGIVPGDEQFIPRAFHSGISLETVLKLSGEWHEAVARDLSGPQCRFPPPWFPAQSIEDYELVPIDNAVALYLEGKTMYHCVASRSYVEAARMGRLCICSIRRQGKRVATIAFINKGMKGPVIAQIRGPWNRAVPQIEKAVLRWLRKQVKQERSDQANRCRHCNDRPGCASRISVTTGSQLSWSIPLPRTRLQERVSQIEPSARFRYEFQCNAVHAVAQAGRRRAVFKDMANMPAAAPAMHLGAFHPEAPVGFGAHRALDRTPETRPAGPALKLGLRLEERQFASGTDEDALAMLVKQRAAACRFRALCRSTDTERA